ncbi:ATPase [Vulcanisaeta thermophila]|uniref:ATPase n=1 Tax=Vulcanisaeta thermophila TaxID=867917 RepID=UPI000852CC6B|nr:ATPase [Vulcanisaeta thermophila]
MSKSGKRRIIIEVDEETYKRLRQIKQRYKARSWAELIMGCLDNSRVMEELLSIRHDVNNIQRDIKTIINKLKDY